MIFSQIAHRKKHPGIVLPGGAFLEFSRPLVMAIINCTPDSFYPLSRNSSPEEAVENALNAEALGADIIDFGAESTRPGSFYVDEEEEIRRLIPVLHSFRKQSSLPVSVDTRKARTARCALDEGADIINDVSALSDKDMAGACAERRAALVIVHCDQDIHTLSCFLLQRAEKAIKSGIAKENIILDPGFGYNKSAEENICLLKELLSMDIGEIEDYPLLIGLSRKRFIGEITGRDVTGRLAGNITANVLAILAGAQIVRVHDTAEAVDMVKVLSKVGFNRNPAENDYR